MFKYILPIVFLLLPVTLISQDKVSEINFAHLYDPQEELFLHYRLVDHPDNGKLLILEIDLNNQSTSLTDYTVSFIAANDYNSALDTEIQPVESNFISQKGQAHFMAYKFTSYPPLIIAKVTSSLSGLSFYQDIRTSDVHHFMLKDNLGNPMVHSYITRGTYDILGPEPIDATYYDHSFPPARAPMDTERGEVPRTMEVTSTIKLDNAYNHIYDDDGLYHVNTGSDATSGESFRVQGPYFPEYVTIPDLIDPLVYITTSKERQRLRSSKEDKAKFDQFWVEMAGSKEKARWIIKNYYEQITNANLLFTTYKEGWKTDRGMIYTIFGTPDQVIREADTETWTYLPGERLPPMTYKFVILKSPYADRQFSLLRSKDHGNGFLAAARFWREARPMDKR